MNRLHRVTLIAAEQKGIPSVWVFVRVFGVVQWFLFFASLMAFGAVISLSEQFTNKDHGESWLKYVAKGMATSYLFALQLGEHPEGIVLQGLRLQKLVLAFFTLVFFIYYTGKL